MVRLVYDLSIACIHYVTAEEEDGITRVSMALQAHVWPDIKMKEQGSTANGENSASTTADKFGRFPESLHCCC